MRLNGPKYGIRLPARMTRCEHCSRAVSLRPASYASSQSCAWRFWPQFGYDPTGSPATALGSDLCLSADVPFALPAGHHESHLVPGKAGVVLACSDSSSYLLDQGLRGSVWLGDHTWRMWRYWRSALCLEDSLVCRAPRPHSSSPERTAVGGFSMDRHRIGLGAHPE